MTNDVGDAGRRLEAGQSLWKIKQVLVRTENIPQSKFGVIRYEARECGRPSHGSLAFEPAKRLDDGLDHCFGYSFPSLVQTPRTCPHS